MTLDRLKGKTQNGASVLPRCAHQSSAPRLALFSLAPLLVPAWAISARGFNAQFGNKLLVTIDGRIVYTPTFAGVYWDTLDLPLDDTRIDAGLVWKPVEHLTVSAVGQNLVRDHHLEFEDVFGSMQSGQVKRGAYVRVSWLLR